MIVELEDSDGLEEIPANHPTPAGSKHHRVFLEEEDEEACDFVTPTEEFSPSSSSDPSLPCWSTPRYVHPEGTNKLVELIKDIKLAADLTGLDPKGVQDLRYPPYVGKALLTRESNSDLYRAHNISVSFALASLLLLIYREARAFRRIKDTARMLTEKVKQLKPALAKKNCLCNERVVAFNQKTKVLECARQNLQENVAAREHLQAENQKLTSDRIRLLEHLNVLSAEIDSMNTGITHLSDMKRLEVIAGYFTSEFNLKNLPNEFMRGCYHTAHYVTGLGIAEVND